MGGRDTETELTLGNVASTSLGETRSWDGRRDAVAPAHDTAYTMDTVLQRQRDCSKSWASPMLRFFFSPENKLNPYSLSWQVLAVRELPPYMCTNAPDPWAAAETQTLISLWKTLPVTLAQADDQTWRLVVPPWHWHTECEWQAVIRAHWRCAATRAGQGR